MSMTAFARVSVPAGDGEVICELRSVNHRYLEFALRLPEALEGLALAIRERLSKGLARGKVDVAFAARGTAAANALRYDPAVVADLVRVSATLRAAHPELAPLALADVLRWPGVMTSAAPASFEDQALAALEGALTALLEAREREGARLAALLLERLARIEDHVAEARASWASVATLLRTRLYARIDELGVAVDPGRLEQEVVFQVQKSDAREELDRLAIHASEARDVLQGGGAIGRRLDFLMQELNREANTLAAKSPSAALASQAVAIKVLVDQMREQVQNIE